MPEYDVKWEIQVTADSPRKAAEEALRVQRDPFSIATVFEVKEMNKANPIHIIDLEEKDANQSVRL